MKGPALVLKKNGNITYMLPNSEITPEAFNRRSEGTLPGHISMVVTRA